LEKSDERSRKRSSNKKEKKEVRKIVLQLVLLLIFWLFVFEAHRIVFILCNTHLIQDVEMSLLFRSLYKGLRLDLSMAAYFSVLPLLMSILFYLFRNRTFLKIIDSFNAVFIVFFVITAVGEACLYREWRSKLSVQALQHFLNPSEVFKTASWGLTLLFFLLTISLSVFFVKIYQRKFSFTKTLTQDHSIVKYIYVKGLNFLIIGAFVLVVMIRGGLQAIPIQSSDPYFSTKPIANDSAVNPLWSILFNVMEHLYHFKDNPFKMYEQKEAETLVNDLFKVEKDTSINILTMRRPNIVFILLEGWSASCVKSYGGDDYAPFLDSLSRDGIRFTKFYPAAYTSDQGIPAVLSGYPSASRISIISQNSKSIKLPCINKDLKKFGYKSGFLFGGDLNYGNIRSYLYNQGFDKVKEEGDFGLEVPRGKLGIHDKIMAPEFLKLNSESVQPFFNAWFTVSTHMPYDFDADVKELVDHKENNYVNSIGYADEALKSFFNTAKTTPWYKNTLFVVVSDHSHASHKDHNIFDSEYHRIPMLFFGEVIKENLRGMEMDGVFSQIDITYTLMKQMGLEQEAKQYPWSKDMFNPNSKNFAYYCSFSGGGLVSNNACVGYQHGFDELIVDRTEGNIALRDSLVKAAKAFQQVFFEDYRLK